MRTLTLAFLLLASNLIFADEPQLPDGYWPSERSQAILDRVLRIELAPNLSSLSDTERQALPYLLKSGEILNTLYERQLHAGAAQSLRDLQVLHEKTGRSRATEQLLDLYYLSKGPIATTLDNQRLAFLPAKESTPGKNVYPEGISRETLDRYIQSNPAATEDIQGERTVVRSIESASSDLSMLNAFPAIAAFHPGLAEELATLAADGEPGLYAIPYALAYAKELAEVRSLLYQAADIVEDDSADFADYLRNRARDFLSSDYESGDAAWVSGQFAGLNMQIGSYEPYDDAIYGVKTFYGASILARDQERSQRLQAAMQYLQRIEDSLPYNHHKAVRSDIPVGVYNVIADFGQARGANTATILPNDPDHTKKYGRTILLRYNILADPEIFANNKLRFEAVANEKFHSDLRTDGRFNRTLWHEVGHYLGVDRSKDGRKLDIALAEYSSLFGELKSDLVSLYAAPMLKEVAYYDTESVRAVYADGILRTLQVIEPTRIQPYQTMQLMQFNYFLKHGLLRYDRQKKELIINYKRYPGVVGKMLAEVLELQYKGDIVQAKNFVDKWTQWSKQPHQVLADKQTKNARYLRTLVKYSILQPRRGFDK